MRHYGLDSEMLIATHRSVWQDEEFDAVAHNRSAEGATEVLV
jgi:hypothetical protein